MIKFVIVPKQWCLCQETYVFLINNFVESRCNICKKIIIDIYNILIETTDFIKYIIKDIIKDNIKDNIKENIKDNLRENIKENIKVIIKDNINDNL